MVDGEGDIAIQDHNHCIVRHSETVDLFTPIVQIGLHFVSVKIHRGLVDIFDIPAH